MTKIFHYINFALIFLFLVGICILEEVIVSGSLKAVQNDVLAIEQVLQEKDGIQSISIIK